MSQTLTSPQWEMSEMKQEQHEYFLLVKKFRFNMIYDEI